METNARTKIQFYEALPKVELHAHLNGSVSTATIGKLLEKKRKADPSWGRDEDGCETAMEKDAKRCLDDSFSIFKVVQQLCDDAEAAYIVACDVIKEFAEDNVKYLELRTTPRANTNMTKQDYIDAVIRAINDSCSKNDICVYLLLSIDRRQTVQDAEECVDLAVQYRDSTHGVVVGVDMGGDPKVGDATVFMPAFRRAKEKGLKLALHLAEIKGQNAEVSTLLSLPPDRIGHGTFLHPDIGGSQSIIDTVTKNNIPLEVCITSNIKCQTVDSHDTHQLCYWYPRGHPCVVCTDDKGVFQCTLSQEYSLAAQALQLSHEDSWRLSYSAIDYIFAGDDVRDNLRTLWNKNKESLLKEFADS